MNVFFAQRLKTRGISQILVTYVLDRGSLGCDASLREVTELAIFISDTVRFPVFAEGG